MEGWNYKPKNWENISPIYESTDLTISKYNCKKKL